MGDTDEVIDSTSSNVPTPSDPTPAALPIPDATQVPELQADVVMADAVMPCSLASLLNLQDNGMAEIAKRIHAHLEEKDLHSLAQVSKSVRESVDKPRNEQWQARLKAESTNVAPVDPKDIYNEHFKHFIGARQMGKNRDEDMREISGPRDRATDRPIQALQQLSFLLFSIASKLHPPEQEIQCLLFQGNLVITSNCVESVDGLHELAKTGLEAQKPFIDVMSTEIPSVKIRKNDNEIVSPSQRTPFSKAAKLYDRVMNPKPGDTFVPDELRAALLINASMRPAAPNEAPVSNIHHVDVDGLAPLLADDTPKIIFLKPGASHAEQNFVHCFQAHPELWPKGPAYIAGKKRPCAACLTTLDLFAARYPMKLHYVQRGGTYFAPAVSGLETLIQNGVKCGHFSQPQINRWLAENIAQQKSYRTKRKVKPAAEGDTGYASVSDSEVEKSVFDRYTNRFNRLPVTNEKVPPIAKTTQQRPYKRKKGMDGASGQPPRKKKKT